MMKERLGKIANKVLDALEAKDYASMPMEEMHEAVRVLIDVRTTSEKSYTEAISEMLERNASMGLAGCAAAEEAKREKEENT